MHTRGSLESWLPIIVLVFAANAGAQGTPSPHAALEDSIQSLRSQARYTDARVMADSLVTALTQDSLAKPYEIVDARQLLATMTTAAGLSRQDQTTFAEADSLAWPFYDLFVQAHYSEAEDIVERRIAIYEKLLGADRTEVAASLYDLARTLEEQGQKVQAESLFERSLAIVEQALGPDHPKFAESLYSLAFLYWRQGQYAQAEPMLERALTIYEKDLHGGPPV